MAEMFEGVLMEASKFSFESSSASSNSVPEVDEPSSSSSQGWEVAKLDKFLWPLEILKIVIFVVIFVISSRNLYFYYYKMVQKGV